MVCAPRAQPLPHPHPAPTEHAPPATPAQHAHCATSPPPAAANPSKPKRSGYCKPHSRPHRPPGPGQLPTHRGLVGPAFSSGTSTSQSPVAAARHQAANRPPSAPPRRRAAMRCARPACKAAVTPRRHGPPRSRGATRRRRTTRFPAPAALTGIPVGAPRSATPRSPAVTSCSSC